ncbi:MAG: DUF5050 domain-containing protein, partial [Bryobacteraceae bacterium]|nr:DUF5050 domain-containing protein [Bryobacteraceae bacterium]
QIWLADADGSRPVALTRLGGNDTRSPRLSPDGRTVAFVANADGRPYVYIAPVSGGTPRRLTADQAEEGVPAWSPDGNWIYFRSMRSGNFEIWRAAPDGTTKQRITHGGASQGLLSHDGATLYFVRNHDGGALMHMPAGGGEAEKLPDGPFVRPESWAVGKDAIWFLDWHEARLMRYELETGRRTTIRQLGHPMFSVGVDIARDGSRIVWSQQDVRTARLAVVHNFR